MLRFRDITNKPDACVRILKTHPPRSLVYSTATWTNGFFDFRNGEEDSTSYAKYTRMSDGSFSIDEYYANVEEGFRAAMEAVKEVILSGQPTLDIKVIRTFAKHTFLGHEKWVKELRDKPF